MPRYSTLDIKIGIDEVPAAYIDEQLRSTILYIDKLCVREDDRWIIPLDVIGALCEHVVAISRMERDSLELEKRKRRPNRSMFWDLNTTPKRVRRGTNSNRLSSTPR